MLCTVDSNMVLPSCHLRKSMLKLNNLIFDSENVSDDTLDCGNV